MVAKLYTDNTYIYIVILHYRYYIHMGVITIGMMEDDEWYEGYRQIWSEDEDEDVV